MENRPNAARPNAARLDDLEPGIRPLVEALNQTGFVQTFSSCEGHFDDPARPNRHHAEVRFLPAPDQTEPNVEQFMSRLLVNFRQRHSIVPVQLVGYKLFTPTGDTDLDISFVLELRPSNRHDPPATHRADIDRAIGQVVRISGSQNHYPSTDV